MRKINFVHVDIGHEATVITPYKINYPLNNYHEIYVPEALKVFDGGKIC